MRSVAGGCLVLMAVLTLDTTRAQAGILCRNRCRPTYECVSYACPPLQPTIVGPSTGGGTVTRRMTITITKTVNGKKVQEQRVIDVTVPADATLSVQNEVATLKAQFEQQRLQQEAVDDAQNQNLDANRKDIDALKNK